MKLVLIFCKFISFVLEKLGRGSTFPGKLAVKLSKKTLNYFRLPELVIAVTGSAGKGSTTSLIAKVMEDDNKKVVYNKSGSNMLYGIVSLLIQNCNLKGEIKADALILEVDERNTKKVFDMVKPKYVIVTNICRDQPPRHGHVDLVLEKIKEALNPSMNLILNADDPYLRKLNLSDENKVTYYGINENKLSYKENMFDSLNIYYCPKCNSKLNYNYYHIDALGDYACKNCDFKRPDVDVLANEIDLDNNYMMINENKVKIGFNILYYAYNVLCAYTLCKEIGINENKICESISSVESNKKLSNMYEYNGKKVYVLNNKNEDNLTFNQSVLFTYNKKSERTIVIGWKEISRRYEYNDMSWMYDIDFELLNDVYTKSVICLGRDRYNLATRIKYAGFKEDQIKIYEDLNAAEDEIKNCNTDIYAILNFDYVEPFNNIMKGR